MKKNKQKIIYYNDLKIDDFSGTNITVKPLSPKYKYVHKNIFWRLLANFVYYCIAKPVLFLLVKIIYHQRFGNKRKIKEVKRIGAILYGNHTTKLADAFVPNILFSFKRTYIISSPETMSIPGIRLLLEQLGVIPLSDKLSLKKKFLKALEYRLNQRALLMIYPEAHIWPFYTKIRPFDEGSFKYAALFDKPVYALTNCYQKRRFSRKPKLTTFIDGPFYPKEEWNTIQNAQYLRDLVYQAMVERTEKYSTYEYVKYVQRTKDTEPINQEN